MNIGIIGLGYVGLPLGVAYAEAGHQVDLGALGGPVEDVDLEVALPAQQRGQQADRACAGDQDGPPGHRVRDRAGHGAITPATLPTARIVFAAAVEPLLAGLGPTRRTRLVKELGGMKAVKQASLDELKAFLPREMRRLAPIDQDPLAAAMAAGYPLGSFSAARVDVEEAEGAEVAEAHARAGLRQFPRAATPQRQSAGSRPARTRIPGSWTRPPSSR